MNYTTLEEMAATDWAKETAHLVQWGEYGWQNGHSYGNYDEGQSPLAAFLDIIDFFEDDDITAYRWDKRNFDYLECGMLGAALVEYAARPGEIKQWLHEVLDKPTDDEDEEEDA